MKNPKYIVVSWIVQNAATYVCGGGGGGCLCGHLEVDVGRCGVAHHAVAPLTPD